MISQRDGFDLHLRQRFPDMEKYFFAAAVLLLSLLVIYGNSFHGTWLLDDYPNIVDNANVHPRSLAWSELHPSLFGIDQDLNKIQRPLSYLTLALNHYAGNDNPFGYHIFNFAVHGLASFFLFCLIFTTLQLPRLKTTHGNRAYPIALLSAFFWATHPIQVTAVTYIVQRMASLTGLFYILTLLAWATARTRTSPKKSIFPFILCGLFFLCALSCKENAILIPFSLLLYDLLLIQGIKRSALGRSLMILAVPILMAVLYSLWQADLSILTSGYSQRPFTLFQRLMTEPRVLLFYLRQIVYPTSSCFTLLHDVTVTTGLAAPWTTLPSIATVFAMAIIPLFFAGRYPLAAFSLLFFLLNHSLEGSILPLEIAFEHRNYIPTFFLFVPVALLILRVLDRFAYHRTIQGMAAVCVAVTLAAWGHTTYLRNDLFRSEIAFWQDNVKKSPNLHRPRHDLGRALLAAGYMDDGIIQLQQALGARAAARADQKYITHYNLGLVHMEQGAYDRAIEQFLKTQALLPGFPRASNMIATACLYQGRLAEALRYARHALKNDPASPDFQYTLVRILLRTGHVEKAMDLSKKALAANNDDPRFLFLMGTACRIKGLSNSAFFYLNRAYERQPNNSAIHLALIELFASNGDVGRLKKQIEAFTARFGCEKPTELIETFRTRHNFLGPIAMETIFRAFQAYHSDLAREYKAIHGSRSRRDDRTASRLHQR